MTKQELIKEIRLLINEVDKKSRIIGLRYYKEYGKLMKPDLYIKMCDDVLAKNLNGKPYLVTDVDIKKLENVLEDLINFCYDNKIISSVYDI